MSQVKKNWIMTTEMRRKYGFHQIWFVHETRTENGTFKIQKGLNQDVSQRKNKWAEQQNENYLKNWENKRDNYILTNLKDK